MDDYNIPTQDMNDEERERERVINEILSEGIDERSDGRKKNQRKGRLSRIRNTPFRDNLYNYSDVLTVILIIVIAALFIFWRVNALLNYNSDQPVVVPEQETSAEQVDTGQKLEQALEDDAEEAAKTEAETQTFEVAENKTLPEIVDDLYNAGMIADKDAFTEAVEQAGAEGELKVGTYEIPVGASDTEIISILLE